jgi:hypothetical protein
MIDRTNVLLRRHVLVVDDSLLSPGTAAGRAVHDLVGEFTRRGVAVTESTSFTDGAAVVASDAGIGAVLVDWDLDADDPASHEAAARILAAIRSRNASLPVFLLAKGDAEHTITVEAMERADELVWILQDTADFIAGRVLAAMDRYVSGLVPPLFGAHRSYSGLVGTSGSNRTVMSGILATGEVAVIDRNCHKSVMQGLQLTGAVPVYMIPSRNRYGIIGPIRPGEMTPEAIAATGFSLPGTRRRSPTRSAASGLPSPTRPPSCSAANRDAGCCARGRHGTGSTGSRTAGACSTRGRRASSCQAWARTARFRRQGSRRPC